MGAIYRRELMAYFNSSLAWMLIASYLFVLSSLFMKFLESFAKYSMQAGMNPFGASRVNITDDLVVPLMWWMGFLMLFMVPLLTMRLIAEESRSGTLEMLFTYPITEAQIIAGKFLAALSVVAFKLGTTLALVFALSRLTTLEWRLIGSGYLGLLLLASAFISFGIWASSTTNSQMIAAVISYGGLLSMWLVSMMSEAFDWVKDIFGDLSVMAGVEAMARGSFSTHNIIYYLAWTGLFLFLTARVLEGRKWSA